MAPRLHLIAPAGSCGSFFQALDLSGAAAFIDLVQRIVGPKLAVTGSKAIINAEEDEAHGGRSDDTARSADLTESLADSGCAAVISIRGGAWLSRILPKIDLSVLDSRSRPIALFGFSEFTTLVNIIARHPQGRGVYDMGPAFLRYGLRRHAERRGEPDPRAWAAERLRPELETYFLDVVSMIEGRGSGRAVTAELIQGTIDATSAASFVGGNLTVFSTLVGSKWDADVRPHRRWLVLEDYNDKIERIDRFLAHLTLADYWPTCSGLLLGDFHQGEVDQRPAVLELLRYHLPANHSIPVMVTNDVGHIYPMAPLPLHLPTTWERMTAHRYCLQWDSAALRTI